MASLAAGSFASAAITGSGDLHLWGTLLSQDVAGAILKSSGRSPLPPPPPPLCCSCLALRALPWPVPERQGRDGDAKSACFAASPPGACPPACLPATRANPAATLPAALLLPFPAALQRTRAWGTGRTAAPPTRQPPSGPAGRGWAPPSPFACPACTRCSMWRWEACTRWRWWPEGAAPAGPAPCLGRRQQAAAGPPALHLVRYLFRPGKCRGPVRRHSVAGAAPALVALTHFLLLQPWPPVLSSFPLLFLIFVVFTCTRHRSPPLLRLLSAVTINEMKPGKCNENGSVLPGAGPERLVGSWTGVCHCSTGCCQRSATRERWLLTAM